MVIVSDILLHSLPSLILLSSELTLSLFLCFTPTEAAGTCSVISMQRAASTALSSTAAAGYNTFFFQFIRLSTASG